MARRLTILDLDRTLFDSGRFLNDLLELLATRYDLDPAAFRASLADHREGDWYDFHRHLAAVSSLKAAEVVALAKQELTGRNYLYADVLPWLEVAQTAGEELLIMTVGTPAFQTLKLAHAPALAQLPRQIVDRNKGYVIAAQLQSAPGGWRLGERAGEYETLQLIDDNPATHIALGPHAAVTAYHLARPGESYTSVATPAHVQRIHSLAEIPFC